LGVSGGLAIPQAQNRIWIQEEQSCCHNGMRLSLNTGSVRGTW
jgi:hypothetical protein